MAVDQDQVRNIARLARLAIDDDQAVRLERDLNRILDWAEQLSEVDTEGVEPMTAVIPTAMKQRADEVTSGDIADQIVANAPDARDHYFTVPKVVE